VSPAEAVAGADPAILRVADAPVTLFGHPPSMASLELQARSRSWRLRKAAISGGPFLLLAPVVALLPPHVPWAVAALGTGFYLARRGWTEEFTVLAFEGTCPRCGAGLSLPSGSRLRFPHSLHCDGCRHEPILKMDRDRLRGLRAQAT
jgi:hypothetical protein